MSVMYKKKTSVDQNNLPTEQGGMERITFESLVYEVDKQKIFML